MIGIREITSRPPAVMKYVLMHPSGDWCGDPITQDHSHSEAEITRARLTGDWSILTYAPFGQVGLNA
jgi:hypothetical protein